MIALRLLREGGALREQVFTELPLVLGRSPEADFVLADASVSRTHARLERDGAGQLQLVDLGSVNGLHAGSCRVAALPIAGPTRCRLGAVEVEIVPVADDPTLEIRLEDWHREEQRRGLPHQALYLGVGVLGVVVTELLSPGFWSPWQRSRASELVGSVVALLVLLPLLAFLLFVALKVAARPVRVADTLWALARVVWLSPLWLVLSVASDYLLPESASGIASSLLGWAACVVGVVFLAGLRRRRRSRAFALGWAGAVTLLWLGTSLTSSLAAERLGVPQNDYTVRPPLAGLVGLSSSLEDYLARVEAAAAAAAQDAEAVRLSQEGR